MKQFERIILREVSELGDPSEKDSKPSIGQTAGTVAKNIAKLVLGKDNIMAKVRKVLTNPSIDELFSWAWAPRKSRVYTVEPIKGDEVVINGIPGFKKYKVGNEILQILGVIVARKISNIKHYYEIDASVPRGLGLEDIQLDFSLIGRSKIGKLTLIKGTQVSEYPCRVSMIEKNKWGVSIITEIDAKTVPGSPGLEDAKAVAAAGRILNNYLGVKNRNQLEGNLSGYLAALSVITEQIRDSSTKRAVLERFTTLTESLSKTEGFESLDIKSKLTLLNNSIKSTK